MWESVWKCIKYMYTPVDIDPLLISSHNKVHTYTHTVLSCILHCISYGESYTNGSDCALFTNYAMQNLWHQKACQNVHQCPKQMVRMCVCVYACVSAFPSIASNFLVRINWVFHTITTRWVHAGQIRGDHAKQHRHLGRGVVHVASLTKLQCSKKSGSLWQIQTSLKEKGASK